jgi:hypothetical protein
VLKLWATGQPWRTGGEASLEIHRPLPRQRATGAQHHRGSADFEAILANPPRANPTKKEPVQEPRDVT